MTDWGDPRLPEGDVPGYFLYQGGIRVPTYYVDQAAFAGCGVSAAWTPIGVLRSVEQPFLTRIMAFDKEGSPPENADALEAEIASNPHLHAIIKANLVNNLRAIIGEDA